MARKICVVTGTRAEYGLLFYLMKELQEAPDVELQIAVTGMHLSPEFGSTWQAIERDGFRIDAKVDMLLSGDSAAAIGKSCGLGLIGFSDAFQILKPDLVVLLGDRFEILAAASAAMFGRISIAHLHGGESTEGSIDEAIRHAVTKMAHLHFVAAEPYARRVVQLGESPDRVFNVGAPGLDALRRMSFLSREDLETDLNMRLARPLFLVTYHPATLDKDGPGKGMKELLRALEGFGQATVVFTYPNADTDGRVLIEMIEGYARERGDRMRVFVSLGQQRYLSLMRLCDVVVGNSSSGLTEAPALKRPTVNIGDRQKGRLKADSVIDAEEQAESIAAAIHLAMSAEFEATVRATKSLYGEANASAAIAALLRTIPLDGLLKKRFHPG